MPPHSPALHDAVDVVQRLLSQHQLRDVACEYRDGMLQMSGRVASFYQKQLAQEIARRAVGAVRVVNEIDVESCDRSRP
jgi:osmotically-inducible protein OsmY